MDGRSILIGMERLRRTFAIVFSAVFLLALALPALCGKCDPSAAKSDCAEDHGGKTKQPAERSSGYTDCDHCDKPPGISVNRRIQADAPEFVIFLRDSNSTPHQGANRVARAFATSPTNSVDGAVPKYFFVADSHPPKTVDRHLTVSLKI
jgi:hypothetical protein